jgi:hypothetical protein
MSEQAMNPSYEGLCKWCGEKLIQPEGICPKCDAKDNSNKPVVKNTASDLLNVIVDNAIVSKGGYDWLTTLLLCFFVGFLGVHRFYTGNTMIGVFQLLTFGGCGLWSTIDLITIATGSYRDGNGKPLLKKI